jgi:hypothetical protein
MRFHRGKALVAMLLAIVLIGFGTVPAVAAPAPAAPGEWSDPLPGYDPADPNPPHGPWKAYSYPAASELAVYATRDQPTAAELKDIGSKRRYASGTRERMFASWIEKRAKLQGLPAAEVNAKWRAFVKSYIQGIESDRRGIAYEGFASGELGIAGSGDYTFGEKSEHGAVEPDAFPTRPELKRGFEYKATNRFTARSKGQMEAYVDVVDATGVQIVVLFDQRPAPATLRLIDKLNRQTTYNAGLRRGATPVPAIVARILPGTPQALPPEELAKAASAGGTLAAPGSAQLPVDGALATSVEASPDSAQAAAEENAVLEEVGADTGNADVGATDPLGGVDFSTLELRYLSDTYRGGSGLGYAFSADAAPAGQASYGGRRAAQLASDAFFVWLSLPTSDFTVNLNPDEPGRIMDAAFGRTDAGRVLLEADLRMKKSVARFIHPDTTAGARYWNALRGEEKCASMRQWIVPAPATVREDDGRLYIIDAPLQVKMETDYTKTAGAGGNDGCGGQSKADTKHNEDLYRSTILPQVQKAVNTAPEYADLRRVYVSRVAAQWYRERSKTKKTAYAALIDTGDVAGWPLREPWTPRQTFDAYVKSYTKGEFKVTHKTTKGNYIETMTYVYGGVDLTNIPRLKLSGTVFSGTHRTLPDTVQRSVYVPTGDAGGKLLWLGGETTSQPLTVLQAGLPSPTSRPGFWIVTLIPLLLWATAGALLLARRRHRPSAPSAPTPAAS